VFYFWEFKNPPELAGGERLLSGYGVGGEVLVDLLALGVAGEAGGREVGAAAQDDHVTERGRLLGEPVPTHPFGVVGLAV